MASPRACSVESAILSEALRAIRRRRGLRQAQVARAMGIALKTYQNFENGRTEVDVARIKLFARTVDCDANGLIAAVLVGSPNLALRSADNKGVTVLMTALGRFDERIGDDFARIEVGRFIAAFRKVFQDLEAELAGRDAQTRAWLEGVEPAEPIDGEGP